jgi:hypothetical protein
MAYDTVAPESVSQDATKRATGYLDSDTSDSGRPRRLGIFELIYAMSVLRTAKQSQGTVNFALPMAVAMANQFCSRDKRRSCNKSTSRHHSTAPLPSGCARIGTDALQRDADLVVGTFVQVGLFQCYQQYQSMCNCFYASRRDHNEVHVFPPISATWSRHHITRSSFGDM